VALQPLADVLHPAPQQPVTWQQLQYAFLFAEELEKELRFDAVQDTVTLIYVLMSLHLNTRAFIYWLAVYCRQHPLYAEHTERKKNLTTMLQQLTLAPYSRPHLPSGLMADPSQPPLGDRLLSLLPGLQLPEETATTPEHNGTLLIQKYSMKEWSLISLVMTDIAGLITANTSLKELFRIICPILSFTGVPVVNLLTFCGYMQPKNHTPELFDRAEEFFRKCTYKVQDLKKAFLKERGPQKGKPKR
jgi:hypothetical protein